MSRQLMISRMHLSRSSFEYVFCHEVRDKYVHKRNNESPTPDLAGATWAPFKFIERFRHGANLLLCMYLSRSSFGYVFVTKFVTNTYTKGIMSRQLMILQVRGGCPLSRDLRRGVGSTQNSYTDVRRRRRSD